MQHADILWPQNSSCTFRIRLKRLKVVHILGASRHHGFGTHLKIQAQCPLLFDFCQNRLEDSELSGQDSKTQKGRRNGVHAGISVAAACPQERWQRAAFLWSTFHVRSVRSSRNFRHVEWKPEAYRAWHGCRYVAAAELPELSSTGVAHALQRSFCRKLLGATNENQCTKHTRIAWKNGNRWELKPSFGMMQVDA